MFARNEIVEMNRRAAVRAVIVETNVDRQCSYSGDANGVVLHSALRRNTAWLPPRRAKDFLRRWNSVNSVEAHNRLVEAYFA